MNWTIQSSAHKAQQRTTHAHKPNFGRDSDAKHHYAADQTVAPGANLAEATPHHGTPGGELCPLARRLGVGRKSNLVAAFPWLAHSIPSLECRMGACRLYGWWTRILGQCAHAGKSLGDARDPGASVPVTAVRRPMPLILSMCHRLLECRHDFLYGKHAVSFQFPRGRK